MRSPACAYFVRVCMSPPPGSPGPAIRSCRRTGQSAGAHEHLIIATTMYREMDMRLWLEQAEAETGEFR